MWTVGRVLLWPNGFYLGDHCEWRVPVDETNTLSISWLYDEVPADRQPFTQTTIPTWRSPIRDKATGRWISSHVINQDIMAWVGQGDRGSHEGTLGCKRPRHRDDEAPFARRPRGDGARRGSNIRHPDPARNERLKLPNSNRAPYGPVQQGQVAASFAFHAGQPEQVQLAYEAAMGRSTG